MADHPVAAQLAIDRCRRLATYSEEPGCTTRTYLSAPMHDVHRDLRQWLEACGCEVTIDAVGNLRALYGAAAAPRIAIVSHLDTVPHAGAFDGILGVVLGLALIEWLDGRAVPVSIEVIGFSEEEGVRYGTPFFGSRAVVGTLDLATVERIAPAIREFGLDPALIHEARLSGHVAGSLEFHIEQGPVLEGLDLPLAVVDVIAGQSRVEFLFEGAAAHAGATPSLFRKDALAAAAEWIGAVEAGMQQTPGLMATIGRLTVAPGAANVVPGTATAILDIRHASDSSRHEALQHLVKEAERIAVRRGVRVTATPQSDLAATPMDTELTAALEAAVVGAGFRAHRMPSGAGHDSMILAPHVPTAMLFLRSPGGLSHCPEEDVRAADVAAALACGARFLENLFTERAHD